MSLVNLVQKMFDYAICFSSVGFMTDRLHTYIPSFILAAVTEFTGAALLLVLICSKKQTQNCDPSEYGEGVDNEHRGAMLWETNV